MKTIEGRNLEFTLLRERSQSEKGICCVVPTNGILEKPKLSDQISRSVVSDSLQPHESQHARPPWPSPTPGVH